MGGVDPSAARDKPVLLFLHLPKTGGTTLSSCVFNNQSEDTSSDAEPDPHPRAISRFYGRGVYYYPLGFYKNPPGPLPWYVLEYLAKPELTAVVGHFSYGIHRCLRRPSTYVTMLRDPVERIVSLYYHHHAYQLLNPSVTLEDFVQGCPPSAWAMELAGRYPIDRPTDEDGLRELSKALVDNDQTRRLAGREPAFGCCDESLLEEARRRLREDFSVVGVTDRFDETLVLLQRRLAWSQPLEYLPRLVNRDRPEAREISEPVRALIEERNPLDRALYDEACRLLDQSVAAEGPGFREEVERLRAGNQELRRRHAGALDKMGISSATRG